MTIAEDAFLTGVVGRPVLRVGPDATPAEVAAHAAAHPGATYYTRVGTADTPRVAALTDVGMRVVDCGVTLERPPGPRPMPPDIETAGPGCADEVARIGGSAFGMSRFHLDPGMRPGEADAIKRAWARNCATGERGVGTIVARAGGRVAGFLSVVATGDARVIDLVAVDAAHRGAGLGRRLVEGFIARWSDAGLTLRVGTQAANTASLRLYESCGFRVAGTSYAMHGHS